MSKSDRIYKIFMSTMVVVIAGLLLATGIIAIQKQMRMKVSFSATPSIECQIDMKTMGADDSTYTKIFNNKESAYIGAGLSLSGNTLYFTEDFAKSYSGAIGASFTLRITNLNDFGIKVTSSGENATSNPLALKLQAGGQGTMDVSGVGAMSTLQLSFVEYNVYTVATSPQSGHFTFSGEAEAVKGEDYTANVKAHDGYTLTISITNDGGTTSLTQDTHYTWDSSTGVLRIYSAAVTGNITISCSTSANSYTATFDGNGGTDGTGITADFGAALGTLPTSTRTGYTFNGWYTATSGGTKITESTTMPLSGATYYAQWTAITYTVVYNANGGSGTMSNSTLTYDKAQNLTANAFSRSCCTFKNWNTAADGNGTTYTNSQSVTNLSSTQGAIITLYAQWEGDLSTAVTYTKNGLTFNAYSSPTIYQTGTSGAYYVYYTTAGTYSSNSIEWIVLGGSLEENYKGGSADGDYVPNETLFLSSNYGTSWYATSSGFYIGGTQAKTLLLLSRYVLENSYFYYNSGFGGANQYSKGGSYSGNLKYKIDQMYTSDTLGLGTTVNNKILATTVAKTTYYNGGVKTESNLSLRFFPLGGDTSYSSSQPIDSFNVSKYLTDATARIAYSITNKTSASFWWLRSGVYGNSNSAIAVDRSGKSKPIIAFDNVGVRPCFVFNLA